jgi:hypothetical protein
LGSLTTWMVSMLVENCVLPSRKGGFKSWTISMTLFYSFSSASLFAVATLKMPEFISWFYYHFVCY